MSTRGAVLLAIGMLILGLLIGVVSGGIAGYFFAQSARPALGQNLPLRRVPNNAQPVPTPRSQVPNPRNQTPSQNVQNGAVVASVEQDSPAAKAGLQVGDVIMSVDGTNVDQNHSLSDLIQAHKPGDKITLAVTRGSQNLTPTVELGQAPQNANAAYLGIRFSQGVPGGNTPRFRQPGSNFPNG